MDSSRCSSIREVGRGRGSRRRLSTIAFGVALAIGWSLMGGSALASSGHTTRIQVAPWGNDAWSGSEQHPFRTLKRAREEVRANTAQMKGDIVVEIHGGTYRLNETLDLSDAAGDSGENGHQVIYQAVGYGKPHPDRPVISGGEQIEDWEIDDPAQNIWRADVGNLNTRQLFVNGKRARRASISTDLPTLTRTATGFSTPSKAPLSWSQPDDIELVFTGAFTWSEPRCDVDSIAAEGEGSALTMDEPCFRHLVALYGGGSFPGVGLNPARIENSFSFLTEPGTFYLDRSVPGHHVLYYIPRPGEHLHDEFVAPMLERLVDGQGTDSAPLHDVSFRGLTFADATWMGPSSEHGFVHYIAGLYEDGEGSQLAVTLSPQAQSMPGNVVFRRADGIVLEGNRFERLGGQGVELVGSDSVIRGNLFTDISGGGILVGDDRPETAGVASANDLVDNNWVHGVSVEYQGSVGIFATRTTDLTVSHNQVNDMPYSGIFVGQGHEQLVRANGPQDPTAPRNTGARIIDNEVFNFMNVLSDGGGIYTTFRQGTSWQNGALIQGNVVHGQHGRTWAIYTDWGSSWVRVENNLMYDYFGGSTGGCSVPGLGAGIAHIQYAGNFLADSGPEWACGPVEDIEVTDATQVPLEAAAAESACSKDRRCRAIVRDAGLEPRFENLLSE
jgi:hypothetical protein